MVWKRRWNYRECYKKFSLKCYQNWNIDFNCKGYRSRTTHLFLSLSHIKSDKKAWAKHQTYCARHSANAKNIANNHNVSTPYYKFMNHLHRNYVLQCTNTQIPNKLNHKMLTVGSLFFLCTQNCV